MRREFLVIGLIALVIVVTIMAVISAHEAERQTEIANAYVRLMNDCRASAGRTTDDCGTRILPLIEAERDAILRCHRAYPSPDATFIACLSAVQIELPY